MFEQGDVVRVKPSDQRVAFIGKTGTVHHIKGWMQNSAYLVCVKIDTNQFYFNSTDLELVEHKTDVLHHLSSIHYDLKLAASKIDQLVRDLMTKAEPTTDEGPTQIASIEDVATPAIEKARAERLWAFKSVVRAAPLGKFRYPCVPSELKRYRQAAHDALRVRKNGRYLRGPRRVFADYDSATHEIIVDRYK